MTARRLQLFKPDSLSAERRRLYNAILKGKRATGHKGISLTHEDGALVGPFNAMLLSPHLGKAMQRLGEQVRFSTTFTPMIIETVVLLVATKTKSEFEWHAHEAIARLIGMPDNYIAALKAGKRPDGIAADAGAAWDITNDLLTMDHVTDETYVAGVTAFAEAGVFEIAAIVGYYRMIAGVLGTFNVEIPGR